MIAFAHSRRTSIVALLLLVECLCRPAAWANPGGGVVAQGTATIAGQGSSQVTINQSSSTTFINWQSFNIQPGETTTFVQPSSSSVAWNYINNPMAPAASTINGNLNANGYVVLQNPNGFTIGGSAAITAHGLVMTTASTPPFTLSGGGSWEFDAPPPAAQIINYGQINIAGGGSAFLIANDIVNNGTISAPAGNIGLYAGEKVLVSTSPDGRGLSAQVTLPQGSVDNEGNLIADAGNIAAQAQVVNQGGLVQANSAVNVNGTIELVASDSLTLGANSVVSAQGGAQGTSPGGSVTIQSGNTFSDQAGSTINISGGAQGGQGGQVQISAPQMSSIQSTINGQANAGFANGSLSIDTDDILLNSDGSPAAGTLALNVNSLSTEFSQISLQAADNIELSSQWNLAARSGILGMVSLLAGNTITLDPGSEIEADGGSITLNAKTVNQNGTLQANSINNANGVIEIDASDAINLGANSVISANGDLTAATPSPGGFVVLKSGNTFADTPTSTINVSEQAGGQDGIVEIFGNGPVQSSIGDNFALLINPVNITLSSNPTDTSGSPNFNIGDLSSYSQIDLHALNNIELSAQWILNDSGVPATLSLQTGNNITLDDGAGIYAGNNWSVNLVAGTDLTSAANRQSGNDGIYLNGSSYIQTQNGGINLWAANEVQLATGGSDSDVVGSGGVRTENGGSIIVNTLYGDVNTGSNPFGFDYQTTAPYYTVDSSVGGISTAAGGNVTINAGGNVTSYLPSGDTSLAADDGGSGAFGPEPGNVTITAGGNIYGHYVLADGVGIITAGQNVGNAGENPFALSLIDGSWTVNAPNGNIYLQEVRNPNGVFSDPNDNHSAPGYHLFDYAPQSSVDLIAGNGVYLTGASVPRPDGPVQIIYPSILDISAGAGGVTLDESVTLFPSADGNLDITTTGNLEGAVNTATPTMLFMSDSSQTRWTSINSFSTSDHGSIPTELNNPNPVLINILGSMENLNLITSMQTELTVGGNMMNCGFSGENLHSGDVTSITVAGQIYNQGSYSFVTLPLAIPEIPAADLPPDTANTWYDIFSLALNPQEIENLMLPNDLLASQWASYVYQNAALFPRGASANPGFVYNPATGQLGFNGQMSGQVQSELDSPITVLRYGSDGLPILDSTGHFETDTITWVPVPAMETSPIDTLYTDSQGASTARQLGYRIGGPGEFDVDADSISLGDTYGILSCGVEDPQGGFGTRYQNLAPETPQGATLNVTVAEDQILTVNGVNTIIPSLYMLTSTIAALGGGNVNVTSTGGSLDLGSPAIGNQFLEVGYGVFTSGLGNVNVTALGNIEINGSRIAAYNGGNIFIESLEGEVNVGSGGDTFTGVEVSYVNPATGKAGFYNEDVFGSGIVANTLVDPADVPGSASVPGNITVETPQGDILSSQGGIIQEALNGNISAGPTITLDAGTPPSGNSSGYPGNIDLGDSGVIGGTVNLTANGNISGVVISRQNSSVNAAGNFSGTVLAGGTAEGNVGGTVSGTIIGVGGVNVAAGGGITATLLGQNVSVNGGASQSTLGTSASATSTSQSASQQASSATQQQVASNDNGDDENKKKKPAIQRIKRVTVVLPKAS
jgi:filamentous hemagglutinin family protein